MTMKVIFSADRLYLMLEFGSQHNNHSVHGYLESYPTGRGRGRGGGRRGRGRGMFSCRLYEQQRQCHSFLDSAPSIPVYKA